MKGSFKKIVILLVAFVLVFRTVGIPEIVEAKTKVGTPKMKTWYKSYDSSKDPHPIGDGVRYTIKWKKVKGASGYQVQKYSRLDKWYKHPTASQKKCSTSIEFSSLFEIKVKVRAYKIVNGRRVYGKWSKMVKKKVFPR